MNTLNFKKYFAWLILVAVILISAIIMVKLAWSDSAIMDELAHIPAGYSYVSQLDYRLNPEHPPLLKALSGLSVSLFVHPNFPISSEAWQNGVDNQWAFGSQFLYQSGNNADDIIHFARLAPILITLLLILFTYLLGLEILGPIWALAPAIFVAFSPNFLSNGHYVTTDVIATFGFVIAIYYFLKFLLKPSKLNLFIAGITFGISQVSKFSDVLLVPYFLLIIAIFYTISVIRDWQLTSPDKRFKRFLIRGYRYLRAVIIIFIIGYVVIVYPLYFLFTYHYPISRQTFDTQSLLSTFAGGPTPPGHICKPMRCLADLDIWMSSNYITRPIAQYLLGVLMVFQRVSGGNLAYFMGVVGNGGWWYYFIILFLLKEPLPILILIFLALIIAFKNIIIGLIKRTSFLNYLTSNFAQFSMLIFAIIYGAISIHSSLDIGFRYLLPILPFAYILTISTIKKSTENYSINSLKISSVIWGYIKNILKRIILIALVILMIIWLIIEMIISYPYYLSYYNEIGGGIWNGYRYAVDSNYDWGQDLGRLKIFLNNHPEIDKIAVNYFGGGNPQYYLGDKEVDWWSAKGSPIQDGIHYFAISIDNLENSISPTLPGINIKPQDTYSWLKDGRKMIGSVPQPDYRAGTSIFIYKL